ncbi:MAG: hypothetical protein HZB51_34635 [Chloroflexi bacterium]|nr:hypothetical protein [Chloroflexota bacterium]
MKQSYPMLEMMLASFILLGCARTPGNFAAVPPLVQAPPTPTPVVGHWDIFLSNGREWDDENGWKIVRIEIVVGTKFADNLPINVYTKDAMLFTDAQHPYPVETLKTTGAKLLAKTDAIEFKTRLPMGYRMRGEYVDDSVMAFSFQARIPQVAKPHSVRIPGYPDIPIQPYSGSFLGIAPSAPPLTPNAQTDYGPKAKLTVGAFERKSGWPSTQDLITAKVTLTNRIATVDSTIELNYAPISDEGIVGAAYAATSDCKPKLTVGPATAIVTTICALIPHGKTKIHLIFWGDGQAVYDTQL